jgi:hypothetical protein
MIITKEGVIPGDASVALESRMRAEATDNSGCGRIWARQWRLATDAKQIGDQVTID